MFLRQMQGISAVGFLCRALFVVSDRCPPYIKKALDNSAQRLYVALLDFLSRGNIRFEGCHYFVGARRAASADAYTGYASFEDKFFVRLAVYILQEYKF